MSTSATYDEVEARTYTTLAKVVELRRAVQDTWRRAWAGVLLWVFAREVRALVKTTARAEFDEVKPTTVRWLLAHFERIADALDEVPALMQARGATRLPLVARALRDLEASREPLADLIETYRLAANPDFRTEVTEAVQSISGAAGPARDWRASLAALQD